MEETEQESLSGAALTFFTLNVGAALAFFLFFFSFF